MFIIWYLLFCTIKIKYEKSEKSDLNKTNNYIYAKRTQIKQNKTKNAIIHATQWNWIRPNTSISQIMHRNKYGTYFEVWINYGSMKYIYTYYIFNELEKSFLNKGTHIEWVN